MLKKQQLYSETLVKIINYMEYNHSRTLESFTDSINKIKEYGFNPIGVSQIYFEDTFVFETDEEAKKAFQLLEVEHKVVQGWFYGRDLYEFTVKRYEKERDRKVLTFWL